MVPPDFSQECAPLWCLTERNCLERPKFPREISLPMELLREHRRNGFGHFPILEQCGIWNAVPFETADRGVIETVLVLLRSANHCVADRALRPFYYCEEFCCESGVFVALISDLTEQTAGLRAVDLGPVVVKDYPDTDKAAPFTAPCGTAPRFPNPAGARDDAKGRL